MRASPSSTRTGKRSRSSCIRPRKEPEVADSRTLDKTTLESKVLSELQGIAVGLGVEGHQRLRKADLIQAIMKASNGKSSGRRATADTAAPDSADTDIEGAEDTEDTEDTEEPEG